MQLIDICQILIDDKTEHCIARYLFHRIFQ